MGKRQPFSDRQTEIFEKTLLRVNFGSNRGCLRSIASSRSSTASKKSSYASKKSSCVNQKSSCASFGGSCASSKNLHASKKSSCVSKKSSIASKKSLCASKKSSCASRKSSPSILTAQRSLHPCSYFAIAKSNPGTLRIFFNRCNMVHLLL